MPLNKKEVANLNIDYQYLGYYLKWDLKSYYYASEHTGFQANTERTQGSYSKYSRIDDRIDLSLLYKIYKILISRASDAAQEIRNKKITREEGINLVKKYDDEFPINYFKDFLEYIDISENIFGKLLII